MAHSDNDNYKFEDIYKEFEEKIFLKEINSTKNLRLNISKHIINYFIDKSLKEITYDKIENYKTFRISQLSKKPKNKNKNINSISLRQLDLELITLRKFFNYCLKKDLININPVKTKNSFKRTKPGRHSIDKFDTKFKIKKDVLELFNIAVKKYEEKRNKAFPIADYINNRLNVLLKNRQFLNSDIVSYREDEEQIKIKIYNFIIADIEAYNLDRNRMLEWIIEEEIEVMDKAYNQGMEKLDLLIQAKNKQTLEFKKIVEGFMSLFNQLDVSEKALIILKFIKAGVYNFLGYLNEKKIQINQEVSYIDDKSTEKQRQRKKALKLPVLSYKSFYLNKTIYNRYLTILEVFENKNSNGIQKNYNFNNLINFKLFELLNNPSFFKKGRFEYNEILYPNKYFRVNLTKSNKELITNLEKKDKFKNVDWHKTMQSIIEYTIILIGEEIDDLDLKKYIPQNIKTQ